VHSILTLLHLNNATQVTADSSLMNLFSARPDRNTKFHLSLSTDFQHVSLPKLHETAGTQIIRLPSQTLVYILLTYLL